MNNTFVIEGSDGPTAIFIAGKLGDIYTLIAWLILIIFYGIYIGKMIAQRRRGIQTDQIAKGKEKGKRFWIELILKAATYSVVIVEVVSIVTGQSLLRGRTEFTGAILGLLGDLIFAIAIFTMRDSWRAGIAENDKTEMVTQGIYRFSRNPAFLGFDLVYIGILLMYFNRVLLCFTIWAIVMLHIQILQEEKYLSDVFGEQYEEYRKHTMRYLGRK